MLLRPCASFFVPLASFCARKIPGRTPSQSGLESMAVIAIAGQLRTFQTIGRSMLDIEAGARSKAEFSLVDSAASQTQET